MPVAFAVLSLLTGLVAGMPAVLSLRMGPAVSRGMAGVGFSFLVLTAAIAAERVLVGSDFVGYAVASVLAYLGTVTVAALRHACAQA